MTNTIHVRVYQKSHTDTMKTEEKIPATFEALSAYLKKNSFYLTGVKDVDVGVQFYDMQLARKSKEEWIIIVHRKDTAFTSGPVKHPQ